MAVIFSLEINFDLRDGPFLARGLEGKAIKFITVITHVVVASQVLLIILQGLTRLILSCPPATAAFDMPLCKNVYVTTSEKMCMQEKFPYIKLASTVIQYRFDRIHLVT